MLAGLITPGRSFYFRRILQEIPKIKKLAQQYNISFPSSASPSRVGGLLQAYKNNPRKLSKTDVTSIVEFIRASSKVQAIHNFMKKWNNDVSQSLNWEIVYSNGTRETVSKDIKIINKNVKLTLQNLLTKRLGIQTKLDQELVRGGKIADVTKLKKIINQIESIIKNRIRRVPITARRNPLMKLRYMELKVIQNALSSFDNSLYQWMYLGTNKNWIDPQRLEYNELLFGPMKKNAHLFPKQYEPDHQSSRLLAARNKREMHPNPTADQPFIVAYAVNNNHYKYVALYKSNSE